MKVTIETEWTGVSAGRKGRPTAKATSSVVLPTVRITADLIDGESWVADGFRTLKLFEHERTHLRIAEEVARKGIANLFPIVRSRTVTHTGTLTAAMETAKFHAKFQVKAQVQLYLALLESIDDGLQDTYDTETDGGRAVDGTQEVWNAAFAVRVAAAFAARGMLR